MCCVPVTHRDVWCPKLQQYDYRAALVPQNQQETGAPMIPANEPTHEEIEEYAVYLGMNPEEDVDLLYIAEWALTAPLPDGWTEHR